VQNEVLSLSEMAKTEGERTKRAEEEKSEEKRL
jgi:hypothetical protein